ncbi:MAG TPA: hypothetical protein VIY73_08650 [Polyangiaceae bacterium]
MQIPELPSPHRFLSRAPSGALLVLVACTSNPGAAPDAGPADTDARAAADAGARADSGFDASLDGHASSSGGNDGAPGGGDATSSGGGDATSSGGGDGGVSDAGEEGCSSTDGGPYVALAWNEGCSSTVTGYVIEWGDVDGGPYPYSADAGDSCDASACEAGADAEAFCQYDLRGLEAGTWCIAAEACDDTTCSVPSSAVCVDVPPACP